MQAISTNWSIYKTTKKLLVYASCFFDARERLKYRCVFDAWWSPGLAALHNRGGRKTIGEECNVLEEDFREFWWTKINSLNLLNVITQLKIYWL
jgi:hypothetical protein